MTTLANSIKKNLPTIITLILLFAIIWSIGLIATNFSPAYVVKLVNITNGSPPNAELEINARKGGSTNIKIELFRNSNLAASGNQRLDMFAKQTEVVVIPLSIKQGYTDTFGKHASYNSIKVIINNKKINWKWKK